MVPELLGIVIGVIAGIVPGIHPNTFASLMLGFSFIFSQYFSNYEIAILLFVASIVYSVVNIIPAVFVGIPDEDTSLAVFPGHRLVLDGQGFNAISLSVISSFISSAISIPLYYLLLMFPTYIESVGDLTKIVLILVIAYLIYLEREPFGGSLASWKKRFYSLLIIISSGFLGYISLQYYDSSEISVLFPLLSGLFAFPTLIASVESEKIPEQKFIIEFPRIGNILRGVLAGLFVSLFPGISSGVATALSVRRNDSERDYISSISSANTANTLLNFAVLVSTGRVRSGIAEAFSRLTDPTGFALLPFIGISAAFVALGLTFLISLPITRLFNYISPSKISKAILIFLVASVYFTNGFSGLAIFAAASSIGTATLFLRVRRISCMGVIILPTLFR